MNFAIAEAIHAIPQLKNIDNVEFTTGIKQAAEAAFYESMVFAHVLNSAKENDEIFKYREKYRDLSAPEVDIVLINRETNMVHLIEIISKLTLSENAFQNEARHLFDSEILKNIGIDDSFKITRVLIFNGESGCKIEQGQTLLCINITDYLEHYSNIDEYFNELSTHAEKPRMK